jgi:hypothetical protein
MIRLVLLNGPKHVGKDTLYQLGWNSGLFDGNVRISEPVKDAHIAIHEEGDFTIDPSDNAYKEQTNALLGVSNRHLLFDIGNFINGKYGPEYLGKLAGLRAKKLLNDGFECIAVLDARILEQSLSLIEASGLALNEVVVVQLQREGHSFEGDMGAYYTIPGVATIVATNIEGAPDSMFEVVNDAIDNLEKGQANVAES